MSKNCEKCKSPTETKTKPQSIQFTIRNKKFTKKRDDALKKL